MLASPVGSKRLEQARYAGGSLLLSALAAVSSPFDCVLAGMVGAGLGIEAICLFLGLTRLVLDDNLVRLGLRTPHDRPLRKTGARGWSVADIQCAIQWRRDCIHPDVIGQRLGRSANAVRAKLRRIGVPSPDRKALRRVDPQSLTPPVRGFGLPGSLPGNVSLAASDEPALAASQCARPHPFAAGFPRPTTEPSQPTADGRTASVPVHPATQPLRPVPTGTTRSDAALQPVPSPPGNDAHGPNCPQGKLRRPEANWDFVMGISLRYFGGQHYKAIGQAMGLTGAAVRSVMSRLEIPRDHARSKFGPVCDLECARATLAASGYELVRDSSQVDRPVNERALFWRHKKDKGVTKRRAARFREGKLGEYDKYKCETITLVTRADLDAAKAVEPPAAPQPTPFARHEPPPSHRSQNPMPASSHDMRRHADEKLSSRHQPSPVRSGLPGRAGHQVPWPHAGHGGAARGVAHP